LYFGIGYIKQKFVEYQLRLTQERFQREQIRKRFEQTQEDASYTIFSLCHRLNASVFESLNVEEITRALQMRRLEKKDGVASSVSGVSDISSVTNDESVQGDRKSKNELWQELKVVSLTRLITLIYADALMVLFTRLQLNILARREYLEDALELASKRHGFNKIEMVDRSDHVNEEAYLSFSWWMLNRGWIMIRERVKSSVEEVFEEITPRYELDVDELSVLLQKTQLLIERDLSLDDTLLPPKNLETFVVQQTLDEETLSLLTKDMETLRVLVDETHNYVSSSSSQIVLNSLINVSFGVLLKEIDALKKQENGRLKLAVVLATTSKLAHVFKKPELSEFVQAMDRVVELDELSASVYSNFG
jgi:peroxin-3